MTSNNNAIFNTDPEYLSSKLFFPDRPRIGATTSLNINVLPDFIQYIKKQLTSEELISLSEYQLQTYLIQLSVQQKNNDNFGKLVDKIICHIRERKQFWINKRIVKSKENQEIEKEEKRHQHQAIEQFQKDIQIINAKIPQYEERPFNNAKKRRIYPFVEVFENTFIDKGKQVLKINFTNYALMPAYVLKSYISNKQQKQVAVLPKYEHLKSEQKHMLSLLQGLVEYLLMGQRSRNMRKNYMKTRQLIRKRNVPSYLENKDVFHTLVNEVELSSYERESQHRQMVEQQEEESDSQNQFYHNFHEIAQKKQFYQSKMFSKVESINRSHNVLEILKCFIYLLNNSEAIWFQKTWKELQEQRIIRLKRRREEQEDEIEEQSEQQQDDKNQKNIDNKNVIEGSQKDNKKVGNTIEKMVDQNQHLEENKEKLENQEQLSNNKTTKKQIQQVKQGHKQNISCLEQEKPIELNKVSSSSSSSDDKIQNEKNLEDEIIQIGIKKPIFDESWKNPNFSFKKLFKHLQDRFLTMREIYFVAKSILSKNVLSPLNLFRQVSSKQQTKSKTIESALLNPDLSIQSVYLQFKQMVQHPQNVKLTAFKTEGITIPWEEKDYLLFLKGLLEFFFIPTNNRKIALYMMSKSTQKNIQANHVKYVKGIYLKNMQIRIDKGQSGGGKKGKMQGKTQFLQKDIELFSMKWFDKIKKGKKKRTKRRLFEEVDDAAEQIDSAY